MNDYFTSFCMDVITYPISDAMFLFVTALSCAVLIYQEVKMAAQAPDLVRSSP